MRALSPGNHSTGGALQGIRVLECALFQQGAVTTMLLGDLGADVVKIEERLKGDPARGIARVAGGMVTDDLGRRNLFFEVCNRNKRSITLDLKKYKGKKIFDELVARSDVFVHNLRGSAARGLGLDYESLSSHNPRLIYAHSSGWGPKGPHKDDPSFDLAALARSGFLRMITEPERDPAYPQGGIADQMGAITTALGILTALLVRERTGVGQRVDASILGGMSYLLAFPLSFYTMAGIRAKWVYRGSAANPLFNTYRCGDGRWMALVHVPPDKYWHSFCRAMDLEELEKDPRFDSMDMRAKNCQELIAVLDEKFLTKSSSEWANVLKENDLVFSLVNDIAGFAEDPQMLSNEYVVSFDHPAWGRSVMAGFPFTLSETPCSVERGSPELGQHTEEVLMELLGYTWDDIARLKDEEVI